MLVLLYRGWVQAELWAPYQIRKNCGLRMRRKCREHFSRHRGLAIPTCSTARDARAMMNVGIANKLFPLKSVAGKAFPAFSVYAQPAILRIW